MSELIAPDDPRFYNLFRHAQHTAFRLEVRTAYGVAEEDDGLRRFLAGEPTLVEEWLAPWLDLMREQTGQGKRVERVRVVDDPPSPYLRFEIAVEPHNRAAGEDIRYLDRKQADALDLPRWDFWMFDSRLVARLEFGDRDRFLGVRLDDDPATVVEHCAARDAAWHYAVTSDRLGAAARP